MRGFERSRELESSTEKGGGSEALMGLRETRTEEAVLGRHARAEASLLPATLNIVVQLFFPLFLFFFFFFEESNGEGGSDF